ncbi:MAG: TlpA disulfide reductase family protein [Ilumatobacteraceae bacterium]
MRLRKRLLFSSLAVALVASVAIGYVISDRDTSDGSDSVLLDTAHNLDQPLNTNAAVQGKSLPNAEVKTEQGDTFQTADLLGQPLIVNIWTSTCLPCAKEMPDLVAAHREFGDRVRFVGIDTVPASSVEITFAKNAGVDYELFYDGDGRFVTAAGISTQPVTLFVRADGTIIKQTGQLDAATLHDTITNELL